MKRLVSWSARLIVLGMLVISALLVATHSRVQPVLTGSMAPRYPIGTLVATTPVDSASLHVGQVVLFTPPEPYGTPSGGPVLHRVVSLAPGPDGHVQVRTKGDANQAVDPWTLDATTSSFSDLRASSVAAGRALTLVRASTRGPGGLVWGGVGVLWVMGLARSRKGKAAAGRAARYQPRHAV